MLRKNMTRTVLNVSPTFDSHPPILSSNGLEIIFKCIITPLVLHNLFKAFHTFMLNMASELFFKFGFVSPNALCPINYNTPLIKTEQTPNLPHPFEYVAHIFGENTATQSLLHFIVKFYSFFYTLKKYYNKIKYGKIIF